MSTMPITNRTRTVEARCELANRLFREFYASCFWHYRPDLSITEESVPLVIRGLRRHGGKKGLLAAAQLTSFGVRSDVCP
jgi:hypothetical protein